MLKAAAIALGLWAAGAGLAWAQASPTATELRAGLEGRWVGALGYRDYQTDRLFELPVRTSIDVVDDGVTAIRRSAFDDGPAGTVWIVSTSLDDPQAGTVTTATFREGREVELLTETVEIVAYEGPQSWTIVYRRVGEDDDAPADIRVTETRAGDELLSVKEVRPLGAGDDAWRFRNQTRLTLQSGG
ncbi:hypothetical protein [Brevundimonas sp.]|uniref:hypothetical protein n=1 Tax=Brevundimonas sp. TaxID=1871086 RepID=UPI0025F5CC8E|nr:hypothetical protein [Brevundimonas sp.]